MNKKPFLFLCLSILLSNVNLKAQIRIGFQAGVTKTSPTVVGLTNPKGFTKIAPGFVTEFPLFAGLKMRPSLDYLKTQVSTLTNSLQVPTGGGTPVSLPTTSLLNVNNIQIPLDITLPIKIGKGKQRILLTAGPVVNLSINGTTTTSYTLPGATSATTVTNPLSFGNASLQYKGLDWGTRFGVGYRTKLGIDLMANYKLATDINNSTGVVQKNNILSLTLAYFIIGKGK